MHRLVCLKMSSLLLKPKKSGLLIFSFAGNEIISLKSINSEKQLITASGFASMHTDSQSPLLHTAKYLYSPKEGNLQIRNVGFFSA